MFREDARSFALKLGLLDDYPGLHGISVWVLGSEDPAIWELLAERRNGQGRRGMRLPTAAGGGYPRETERARARDRSIHPAYPLNGETGR